MKICNFPTQRAKMRLYRAMYQQPSGELKETNESILERENQDNLCPNEENNCKNKQQLMWTILEVNFDGFWLNRSTSITQFEIDCLKIHSFSDIW